MRISIFDNQYSAIQELPEERQGAFWMALMAYVFEDKKPTFTESLERIIWSLILPVIDQAKEASKNGSKGGRPKGKQGENKGKTTHKNPPLKPPFKTPHEKGSLSEKESEREGLGVSLKDTLTLPPADAAGGNEPAAPRVYDNTALFAEVDARFPEPQGYEPKDMEAYAQEFDALVTAQHPEAVPCPDHLKAVSA